jgi:hypothetical protein
MASGLLKKAVAAHCGVENQQPARRSTQPIPASCPGGGRPPRGISGVAAVGVALLLAGCSASGGLFGGRSSPSDVPPTAAPAASRDSLDPDGLRVYLEMMQRLIEGDPLTQAGAFRDVAEAADIAPTTTNRLKLALALSVPGHLGSDTGRAEQQLSALLAAGASLLPEERVLATIQLRDVEQRLILDSTAERLRTESEAALEAQNAESAARLAAALEENERLRLELEDARERLEAITAIEQSIRERENGPNQP